MVEPRLRPRAALGRRRATTETCHDFGWCEAVLDTTFARTGEIDPSRKREVPSRLSVILPRRRGGGKHFLRVPHAPVRSGPAIVVTTRFRETSRTFFSFRSPLP
jgi:hypothetical protein